jgi:hypothetical protein
MITSKIHRIYKDHHPMKDRPQLISFLSKVNHNYLPVISL